MFFNDFDDTVATLMLNVLLVSPLDPKVPGNLKYLMGGESTYTNSLLATPPRGIRYVHYQDALKSGEIEYSTLNKILNLLVKLRFLPLSAGTQSLKLNKKFDLVHCHSYSIKIDIKIPILLSDSSSNYLFLRDYLGWSLWRIRFGFFLRRQLFGLLGVIDADTNWERAKKLIVFSDFAKRVHLKLGAPKQKIEVIYPGIKAYSSNEMRSKKFSHSSSQTRLRSNNNDMVNILFAGIWFERKGGHLLLEAYRQLSKKYANLVLTIVGPIPKKYKVDDLKLNHFDFVPRERLISEFFPKADIFVLVPPKVEGFGFVVLEAMSFGIPAIVSRVCALSEIVEDEKTGFVIKPGSVDELVTKLDVLIANKKLRLKMGEVARRRFEDLFSIKKTNIELLKIYKKVLNEG